MQLHRPDPSEWDALAEDPEFKALLRARRGFVVPATIFFLLFYVALLVCIGFMPQLMSRPFIGPLTVAYAFALAQFAVAWILLAVYMRRAKSFDERSSALVERVETECER